MKIQWKFSFKRKKSGGGGAKSSHTAGGNQEMWPGFHLAVTRGRRSHYMALHLTLQGRSPALSVEIEVPNQPQNIICVKRILPGILFDKYFPGIHLIVINEGKCPLLRLFR